MASKKIVRSVMKSGGSLTISIPRSWARKIKLREGDYVEVEVAGDKLIISPMIEERVDRVRLRLESDIQSLINKVVAAYLMGYDVIEILAPRNLKEDLEREILQVKDKLMGLEVMETSSSTITLGMVIDPLKLKPVEILRMMWKTSDEMLRYSLESLISGDLKRSSLINRMEDDMDRLYFYMVRILRRGLMDPALAAMLKISSIEMLDYRLAAFFLENIADKAFELMELSELRDGALGELMPRLSEIVLKNHEYAMEAFLNKNLDQMITIRKNIEVLSKMLMIPNLSWGELKLRDILLYIADMQYDLANLIQLQLA